MLKKCVLLSLVIVMTLSLLACGGGASVGEELATGEEPVTEEEPATDEDELATEEEEQSPVADVADTAEEEVAEEAEEPEAVPEPEEPVAQEPAQISWEDAADHVGETIAACGQVVTVFLGLDITMLNVGEIPSEGGVIVDIRDTDLFPDELLTSYYGETICVTGEITIDTNGDFRVYVTDSSQIVAHE